jgi:hypothetical protein
MAQGGSCGMSCTGSEGPVLVLFRIVNVSDGVKEEVTQVQRTNQKSSTLPSLYIK